MGSMRDWLNRDEIEMRSTSVIRVRGPKGWGLSDVIRVEGSRSSRPVRWSSHDPFVLDRVRSDRDVERNQAWR